MSTINERFKKMRKECKKTQSEWGKILGLSTSGVSEIESGRRNVTEQHIIMLTNYKDFNVNEKWLRHGIDEMFVKIPEEDEFFRAATELSKNSDQIAMQAVIEYWKLDEESKKLFKDFIVRIVEKSKE